MALLVIKANWDTLLSSCRSICYYSLHRAVLSVCGKRNYALYIGARLAELIAPDKYHFFRDQEQLFEKTLNERTDIVSDIRQRDALFLQMDHQLKQALICTQQDEQGPLALIHYADNAIEIEEDLL
ncbi:pdl (lipase family) protein [Photorhabdus temperata subsp. temperata M1021]|nr:pdl (lipase family) protein [Photorhabdus temperata subsp. temperata M1021]